MANKFFRFRAFISFFLAFTFLLSALSGIVLFLRPEGSLAAWTGWSALGLDKKGWEALHLVSIVLFFMCAIAHLAYNWRTLFAYCLRKKQKAGRISNWGECIAALLLAGLVVAGTLGQWLPWCWIVDMRGMFKSGMVVMKMAPPAADAEKRPLAELCILLGTSEGQLQETARRNHIRVENMDQTLAEVAIKNNTTPEKIFILLKTK
jgi:hypothetical protein